MHSAHQGLGPSLWGLGLEGCKEENGRGKEKYNGSRKLGLTVRVLDFHFQIVQVEY